MSIKNVFLNVLSVLLVFSASGCTASEPEQKITGKLVFKAKHPNNMAVLENNKITIFDVHGLRPCWSPSGNKIMALKNSGVFICDDNGEVLEEAIDKDKEWGAWDWLGSDNKIVVAERTNYIKGVNDATRFNVVTYDLDTGERAQLTDIDKTNTMFYSFNASSDGKWLVYKIIWGGSVLGGHPYDLYLLNVETKESVLIDHQSANGNFALDNETVVYEKVVKNDENDFMGMAASYIMTYNVKTGKKEKLIDEPYYGLMETFNLSPDLKTLIFSGGGQTYIVDVETGEKKNLFEQFKKKDRKWKATDADWVIE